MTHFSWERTDAELDRNNDLIAEMKKYNAMWKTAKAANDKNGMSVAEGQIAMIKQEWNINNPNSTIFR